MGAVSLGGGGDGGGGVCVLNMPICPRRMDPSVCYVKTKILEHSSNTELCLHSLNELYFSDRPIL